MRRLTDTKVCVRSVAYLPDGRLLSVAGKKSVTVWDPTSGLVVETIPTRMFAFALAVAPNGREFAVSGRSPPASNESQIQVHALADPNGGLIYNWPIRRFDERDRTPHSIWSLAYTGDSVYLIAARLRIGGGNMYNGGDCHWWRRTSFFEGGDLDPPPRGFAVAAAGSGTRFAVTGQSQFLVYDQADRSAVATYRFGSTWAAGIAFLPGGEHVVVGANSFLYFTDRQAAKANPTPLKTDVRTIRTLAVSPDGRTLLVGGAPGRVERYDLNSRTKLATYDFDVGVVQSLAFAPDGLTFAVGAEKGLILVDVE
jgi:WD40 repeat protein